MAPASPPSRASAAAAAASSSSSVASGAQVGHGAGAPAAAPPGHFLRRASKSWDQPAARLSRRVSPITTRQMLSESPPPPRPEAPARRSSNFSDYSLSEARDIINPRAPADGSQPLDPESSPLASLSLAFALLPAVAGALFTNGNSVATDIILLGLAAVFLHWSVTQPWLWYHAAQEVRLREEAELDSAIDDESDGDSPARRAAPASRGSLADVQEEDTDDDDNNGVAEPPSPQTPADARATTTTTTTKRGTQTRTTSSHSTERQRAAARELYRYEVLALLSCFACPFFSAYLLHAIRSQLSRPSEGLVSNYNLTIFLMAAELRVLSHVIKLVQSRTIHLQRLVHQSPHAVPIRAQVDRLLERLERLEALSLKEHMQVEQGAAFESTKASMARDVRGAIQPDLDALNRAVRRYEKKAALLQSQTDAKLADVYRKLDDAAALAALAAAATTAAAAAAAGRGEDGRRGPWSLLAWAVGCVRALLDLSLGTLWAVLTLPFKPALALFGRRKQASSPLPPSAARSYRNGKTPLAGRHLGERVPARLMKRC